MATFDHLLVNNIDFAYMNWSNSGGPQRKAQGMRKNDTGFNMTLKICWEAYSGVDNDEQNQYNVVGACSALIILP